MLRLLLLGGLALAAECGPTVVTDGYFPEDYRVTLTQEIKSKHFDIVYGKNFKVVTNFHAREQYVLTHCGSTAPTDAEVNAVATLPEESAGGTGATGAFVRKSFTVPIQSFGDETGTTHGFGDVLGVNDRIAYMSSSVVSACIQKALDCDATMLGGHDYTVGDDTLLATQIQNVDLYFNDKAYDAAPFTAASDKTVAFTASWDPNMLHIAEWIKFFGAFFNLEDKAEEHFNKISAKWNELSSRTSDKKVVIVNVNGDNLRIAATPYKVSWIEASGATAIGKKDALDAGGSVAVSWNGVVTCDPATSQSCDIDFNKTNPDQAAAFRNLISSADVIIDEASNWGASTAYGASNFETNYGVDLSAKTYRHDGIVKAIGGGSDWYESRYANPHVLLEDLSSLVHGETRTRVYLRRLDESQTIQTGAQCDKAMPACGGSVTAIEAPCERYKYCDWFDALTTVNECSGAEVLRL